MAKMIRVDLKTSKNTKQKTIEEAVKLLDRIFFLNKTNHQYIMLKRDKQSTKKLESELREWDVTLLDGLELDKK